MRLPAIFTPSIYPLDSVKTPHMDTRVVTAHLPADLARKLDGLAERLDRPKGWIVKEAIASFISLEEKRFRLTIEALGDVDAKRTIDHIAVEA